MTDYNVAMQRLTIPPRMRKLPVDDRGYPVPKFVEWYNGQPDFRMLNRAFMANAVRIKLCWLCAEPLGRYMAFVIGPMCCINRVSSEPPSHLDCARFACQACPFITQPNRPRNPHGLPDERVVAGEMIPRNPGVTAIWVTESYTPFKAQGGALFRIGEPTSVEWWSHGRTATREEILASIASGLPILVDAAKADGSDALDALNRQVHAGMALVPAA
jgi:hypothetical protein